MDKTILTSLFLSVLLIEPLIRLFRRLGTTTEIIQVVGTLTGAWIGAFLLPLDWQKAYQVKYFLLQAYPIPLIYGSVLGNSLANLYLTFTAS
jgi:hypothetical protein